MKKILLFLMLVLCANFALSQQNLSTLQKAAGPGYTIYTKTNGGQQYQLFVSALDSSGIYNYIDSLYNTVAGQNGIITALPIGAVSIVADQSNFLIDSLSLLRFISKTNAGTAQSTIFQSASLAAPTIIQVISPTDTNLIAKIQLDADGNSFVMSEDLTIKSKTASGAINFLLGKDATIPAITVQDSAGFWIKFYDRYFFPNATPNDGDVIVFNADGTSAFSAFPSGVNIYNSDGTQTDAARIWDLNNQSLQVTSANNFQIEGSTKLVSNSGTSFLLSSNGTIKFDLLDERPFIIEDSRASQVGLTYNDDYCATIKANLRSIPDVGCISEIIADSISAITSVNIYNSDGVTTDATRTIDVSNTIQFVDTPSSGFGAKIVTPLFSEEISLGRLDNTTGTRLQLNEGKNNVELRGNSGKPLSLVFLEETAQGVNYSTIIARDTLAANTTFVLPNSNGTYNQVLTTDGNGLTTWKDGGTALNGIISALPAGDVTIETNENTLQFNTGHESGDTHFTMEFETTYNADDFRGGILKAVNTAIPDSIQFYWFDGSFYIENEDNLKIITDNFSVQNADGDNTLSVTSDVVQIRTPSQGGEIQLYEGANYVGIKANSTMTTDYEIALPAAQGTGVLQNNGSGALSWNDQIRSVVSGRVIAGTTSAGGTISVTLEGTPQVGYCVVSGNTTSGSPAAYVYSVSYTTGDTATVGVFDVLGSATPCASCTVSFSVICR